MEKGRKGADQGEKVEPQEEIKNSERGQNAI